MLSRISTHERRVRELINATQRRARLFGIDSNELEAEGGVESTAVRLISGNGAWRGIGAWADRLS